MTSPEERRSLAADLEATVAARRELDPGYEPALVESFLDRVEEQVERRVEAELAEHGRRVWAETPDTGQTLALAVVTLVAGVPATAIALGAYDGIAALVVVWAGLVGVNGVFAWSRRPRRPSRRPGP
jgi:hypothetical protein